MKIKWSHVITSLVGGVVIGVLVLWVVGKVAPAKFSNWIEGMIFGSEVSAA